MPEELTFVVLLSGTLAHVGAGNIDAEWVIATGVSLFYTFVNVNTLLPFAWWVGVTPISNVTMTTKGPRHVEAVAIVTAAMCLRSTLIDIATFIVCCRRAIEVPARRRVRNAFCQRSNVLGVCFLSIVMHRVSRIFCIRRIIEVPELLLIVLS
jgi:hypothetical protein